MDYIAQPKDYWIALNAINITLNALGNPNRTQGSVASGAAILCYIEGVAGLGYDNGHRFKTWPLTISPTYFNSNTAKYVYVAIPRTSSVGTQAVVVFPSEKLDIYGKNVGNAQLGSTDYYYIWLQGIITATDGTSNRDWQQAIDFGKKGTDEDLYDDTTSDWYQYSKVSEVVTFLKNIAMKAGTTFQNLILGYKELTGVATSDIAYTDSDVLVATPGYVENQYLSKTHESTAQEQVGFLKGLWVKTKGLFGIDANGNIKGNDADLLGDLNVGGDADVDGILRALAKVLTNRIESSNWTGDGPFDTGFQLLKDNDGVTSMVVDNLFVRMKAIFTELEIRKISYAGGNIIFSHAGSKVVRVEPVYRGISAEVEGHKSILDGAVDVSGNTAYLGGGTVTGHKLTITNSQSLYAYRCYLLADDGSTRTENWWRVDDQARCQTFNIKEGVYQNVSNQFYWRRVIATGSETLEDGKVYYYVDLSAADCMQGSTVPQAGDQLVQMGNRTDTDRQGFISIEVSGDMAPAFKVYRGVNSYTLDGKRKICISPKLTEIRANKFIEETSYGVFVQPRQRDEEWYYGMQCYYYDLVQYDGATWLCIYPESGIGGVMYTTDMPSEDSPYWRIYARKGKDGSDGKSFNILGSYDTEAELIAAHPTGEIGDAYIVAGYLYVWDAVNNRWHNSGQIKGDPGRGIRSAKISYGIGTATDLPSEWKDSVSELSIQPGDYLYVRTILYYTDSTQSDPSYSISRFGLDGAYKATAFCRTNKDISAQQLSGGTMSNAVPNPFQYQGETITFTDGIPVGEAVVWAASNVFYGDGTQAGWTYARRMSDTATFDVEFSPNETKPADPSDDVSQREAQGWYDPTRNPSYDFTNSIWRAERHCKNGVWSAWAIEKIKGEDGASITKQSEVAYYIKNTTGVRPAENDPNWSETKPTLNKGEWLFTKTVITWSDGSTTVLYTDERNPNDGVNGQDIIVDGATVMEYAVSASNVTQPTQWHPYAEIVSQIVPGTWLWSRTTTYYRKASSAAGSHDAGSSVNYSVNYNGTNGINGRAVKSITEYYKATNSNEPMSKPTSTAGWDDDPNLSHLTDKWDQNHKYLWNMEKVEYTESNGTTTTEYTVPQVLAIWTKDGAAGRGIDSIQNYYKVTDSATTPSKPSTPGTDGWSTTPLTPSQGQYLWNYEIITWVNGTPATTETDVQMIGYAGEDGASITKQSETYRYATNNTGTRPSSTSSEWKTTKPTLQKGYWLYTETTITWSDGSKTVLYTDERNPNDGVNGQDIVVDGSTVMKYYVGDSNSTHPAENSSDWKDLGQVTQTQGKWLWSQATTWYKKADSAAGAHDAGKSVNYNVSYIAKDGAAGRGVTGVTEYYKATDSNAAMPAPTSDTGWSTDPNLADLQDKWDENHKYLWNYEKIQYSSGTTIVRTIPQIVAIWTKDGRGIDSIQNYYKTTDSDVAPSKPSTHGTDGWDDNPMTPNATNPYLWNYEVVTYTDETTYESDVQLIGHYGKNITKVSDTREYQVSTNGTTVPTGTWLDEAHKPTPSQGQYLWTRLTMLWSDGSSTVVYSTERNPNDGQPGQDIVTDRTEITYAVTNTNQKPADSAFGPYPSSLPQGKWLWSKATTYYKKATSGAAAGSSSNYNVSYIAVDGTSVTYDEEHSSIMYAVSSKGTPEQGRDYPSDITSWSATMPAVQQGKYLWTRDITAYNDNGTIKTTTTYGVSYWGVDGDDVQIDTSRTFVKYSTQKTASKPADNTFTLDAPPSLEQGDYLWALSQTAYVGVADALKSYSVSRVGTDGSQGDPGPDGYTTHFAYATSADGSQGFSVTNFVGATYIGTYRDNKADDSTNYRDYVWTKWKGDTGAAGRGVTEVKEYYKASNKSSGETAPSDDSGWSDDPNTAMAQWGESKKYLWNYERVKYSSGTQYERTTPSVIAIWTKDGAAGKGIDSIVNYYKVTNSLTPPSRTDSGWDDDPVAPSASAPYLWNYEVITWVNPASTTYTAVQMIGHYGKDGISVKAQYSADGTSWHDAFTTGDEWMRTSTDNGTTWSTAMKIVGENGAETDFSFGISAYKTTANAQTAPRDITSWSDAPMAVTDAKPYLWSKVVQKDGNGTTIGTSYIRLTGEDGAAGTSAATCFLDKSVIFVKVDTDGYVLENYDEFVHFSIYQGTNIIGAKSVQVTEDGHQQYVELTGGKMTDLTGTTITVNNHTSIIHSGASVSGHKVTLTGSYTVAPNALHLRVQRGSLIDEHVATLQVIAVDADGNEHLCIAPLSIQREVIVKDGRPGEDGQPGVPGDDAVNVMLTPENVILEQNEDDESIIDLTKAYSVVSVNKGGAPDNNFTLSIIGREHCQATVDNNTKRVTITQIDTHNEDPTDPSSDSIYYDNGYVDVRITYGGQNYDKRFGFYANLLGTWKRTVVGDAEAVAAARVAYIYDPNNPNQVVKMETFGNYVRSSTENSAKLERDTTEAVENIANTAFEDIEGTQVALSAGEYIVQLKVNTEDLPTGNYVFDFAGFHYEGGEQFIEQRITVATSRTYTITLHDEIQSGNGVATMLYIGRVFNVASKISQTADSINARVDASNGRISQLEITADGLSTTVKNISPSKNLLKGSLSAKGWSTSNAGAFTPNPGIKSAVLTSDGYISMADTDTNTWLSKSGISLSTGKSYTLSFLAKVTTAISYKLFFVYNSQPQVVKEGTVPSVSSTAIRREVTIENISLASTAFYLTLNCKAIKQPQLEEGSVATDFIADSAEVSSGITQTATQIEAVIRDELGETGIDIEHGEIELKANKTKFSTSAGVPMIAVQMCDANGNVGTGSQYTIPSIVFYNGQIGAQGVSVQWVLNYLGFIQATNVGVRYSFVTQYNIYSFLPIDEEEPKVGHIGVDVSETLSPNELARECFYNDFNVETMNLFNCGYYINDGGTKIYQPTQGKNYEMYNNIDAIRRYWLTDAVNNVFVPDDNNNNTASGYYFVPRHHEIENYYSGRWPDSDDWQNYRNTISLNNDPVRVIEAAKVFDLVYFEPWPKTGNVKDPMTPTNVAGIMRVWENAFVVFYMGSENGLQKTCIGVIGGNKEFGNNPDFYPGEYSRYCTPQKIINKYNM